MTLDNNDCQHDAPKPPQPSEPDPEEEYDAAVARATLLPLSAGNVLQAMGLQIFAPILPLYLADRGMSSSLIGLVMGMGIAGYGLGQYPSGLLSDRYDHRRLLLSGMCLYALTFFVYLLPLGGVAIVCVRFFHASVASLYTITAVAVLIDATEVSRRGRAFGLWQASTKAGFLFGPLAGGLLGTASLEAVFVFSGAACFLSFLTMLRLPRPRAAVAGDRVNPLPKMPAAVFRPLFKLMLIASAGDYAAGTFLAIWSIWLLDHGATPIDVGISFSIFALPGVLLSTSFGSYADRHGSKPLLVISGLALALIGPLCGWADELWTLHAVAFAAGLTSSITRPLLSADVSRQVGAGLQARAQSVFFTGLMLVQLLASISGGLLLGISGYLAFGMISVMAIVSTVAAIVFYPLRSPDPV